MSGAAAALAITRLHNIAIIKPAAPPPPRCIISIYIGGACFNETHGAQEDLSCQDIVY